MYIHFTVISQREKCPSAAGALTSVPIGLETIAWPSWCHLKAGKCALLLTSPPEDAINVRSCASLIRMNILCSGSRRSEKKASIKRYLFPFCSVVGC